MWTSAIRARAALAVGPALLCAAGAGALAQDAPLSAIDWLSDSVETAVAQPLAQPEAPVTDSAALGEITVTPLDAPDSVAVGLLPGAQTGFAPTLWGASDPADLARLFNALSDADTPALQRLLETLALAELNPPAGGDPGGLLLTARVDFLLQTGRVDQALALIEATGNTTPDLMQRRLDAALLVGAETEVCADLVANRAVRLTLPSRIFCLARGGDWNAAALTLGTARALGQLDAETEALLSRFLDPELYEGEPVPDVPRISPLIFRLYEAIGEPKPTNALPRAFAVADLSPRAGWKAQLDAVERLARVQAVSPNQVLGIITQAMPSASGGVWDRVEAIQRLDTALGTRDPGAVALALPPAWAAMARGHTGTALAAGFAPRLKGLPLPDTARAAALRIAALSEQYETLVPALAGPETAVFAALATGRKEAPARGALARGLLAGFDGAPPPDAINALITQGQQGEAILRALVLFEDGRSGDPVQLSHALRSLRALGLEDTARRAALETLVAAGPS